MFISPKIVENGDALEDGHLKLVILGIDPGLSDIGYGAVRIDGSAVEYLTSGLIRTDKKKPIQERLAEIRTDMNELFFQLTPDEVAIEQLFFFKNVSSCIKVAMARGVILSTCPNTPVFEYTPMQAKNIACGSGKASKGDIQREVKRVFGISLKDDNVADAVAIALAHARLRVNVQPRAPKEKKLCKSANK